MALVFLIALLVLGFASVSARIAPAPLTPAMVFVAAGVPIGTLGIIDPGSYGGAVHIVAEITLVVVLFTDGAKIDLQTPRRGYNMPLQMLTIGLPLTILGGAAAAIVLPGIGWPEGLLLAAMFAPTDAALGKVVVSSPRVPQSITEMPLGLAPERAGTTGKPAHQSWLSFLGRVGLPLTAAPLVAGFLSRKFTWPHMVLIGTGVGRAYFHHYMEFHRRDS